MFNYSACITNILQYFKPVFPILCCTVCVERSQRIEKGEEPKRRRRVCPFAHAVLHKLSRRSYSLSHQINIHELDYTEEKWSNLLCPCELEVRVTPKIEPIGVSLFRLDHPSWVSPPIGEKNFFIPSIESTTNRLTDSLLTMSHRIPSQSSFVQHFNGPDFQPPLSRHKAKIPFPGLKWLAARRIWKICACCTFEVHGYKIWTKRYKLFLPF